MDNPLKFGLRIIQDGIGLWLHNNAFLRAGALAFYKLFSLAPYVPPRRSSRRCTSSRARSAGSGSILADTNSERERRGAATGARITAAWLLVLFGWSAAASAAVPTATLPAFVNDGSSTPVQIDDSSSMQAIAEGFLIHKEPPGRQMAPADLERILSLPRGAWESGAEPANRASSFVPVTMWMLAVVENPTEVPLERWLMLRSWRLWDARLFAIDVDSGEVLASYETGQRVPMAKRVVQRPEATFPLLLEPRERVLLVLRIEDKSFAVVGAYLVDPGHQIQRAQRLHDVSVALLGFLTAIALILLAQGEWRYAAIAAWLMATAVFEFSFQVPLLQTLLALSDPVLHHGLYGEWLAWAGRFRAHDTVLPGAPTQPLLALRLRTLCRCAGGLQPRHPLGRGAPDRAEGCRDDGAFRDSQLAAGGVERAKLAGQAL
jgi:hypothetical protein